MHRMIEPEPAASNVDHPSEQTKLKPTAVKQSSNIIIEDNRVQVPPLRGFTPTNPNSNFLQSQSIPYHQQNIFQPALTKNQDNQRGKKFTQIIQKIGSIDHRVTKLEKKQQRIDKDKRRRRKNSELDKNHRCPFQNCPKKYESQTALKKHIRTKHVAVSIEEEKPEKQ